MKYSIILFTLFLSISCIKSSEINIDEPLILTPYIESKRIEEGRKLCEVKGLPNAKIGKDEKSYAGYFTVNKTHNSNLFFWFFPAQVKWIYDYISSFREEGIHNAFIP